MPRDDVTTPHWISATKTRNHLLRDPVLDWLHVHGEARGYTRDSEAERYDPRTDFTEFIFEKGRLFEDELYKVLRGSMDLVELERVEGDVEEDVEEAARRTVEVLKGAPEAVAQGCVIHEDTHTFGYTDLLVRSDVLARLWPDAIPDEERAQGAPAFGLDDVHYRVVDIKFSTLRLLKDGTPGNSGSSPAYKGQVFIYTRALGAMQGYEPPAGYLMGRSWEQGSGANKQRGRSALERLAPVPTHAAPKKGRPSLREQVDAAVSWLRRVRDEGEGWVIAPDPSVPELRPNMGYTQDSPWHGAKKKIAEETGELTTLWQVGLDKRNAALERGPLRYQDVSTASEVGVTGPKQSATLDAMLYAQQAGPPIQPETITAAIDEWAEEPPLEFYVDFETVSDLDDDFSKIPERSGLPLIFMIGCGHVEDGQWRFAEFTTRALDEGSEADIIDAWFAHMANVRERLGAGDETRVMHWSHAEVSTLESAYNSAVARHPDRQWPRPNWFDFLQRVVRAQPVVVRGAFGFGLKAIANAMHAHGYVETRWGDGPTDGLGAMVGAWRAAAEARGAGTSMADTSLMREIAAYNEVDCKVMWEVVRHLRAHHVPSSST